MDEIGIVVVLIVDDRENLSLHTNILSNGLRGWELGTEQGVEVTEDAIIERSLVLVGGTAVAHRGVRPMNLVCLAHVHSHAMLPVILSGEPGIISIVLLARIAIAHFSSQPTSTISGGVIDGRRHATFFVGWRQSRRTHPQSGVQPPGANARSLGIAMSDSKAC